MRIDVLGSGSGGNSLVVEGACGTRLMVDMGFGNSQLVRRLEKCGLDQDCIDAVLFTHEHGDHASGAAAFHRRHPSVPFYANSLTAEAISVLFKVPGEAFMEFSTGASFRIGGLNVTTFAISHDVVDPVGYFIEEDGKSVFVGTDTGVVTDGLAHWFSKASCAVLESNYEPTLLWASNRPERTKMRIDGRSGHLSNGDSSSLVRTCAGGGLSLLLAAHRSQECNEPSIVKAALSEALGSSGAHSARLGLLEQHECSVWEVR